MPTLKSIKNKKYFLLDLDGTLYKGSEIFPYTGKFLKALRAAGKKPIFLTNNSSASTAQYASKLKKKGIDARKSEIYTSGRATLEYLQKKGLTYIYLLATPGATKEFLDEGFTLYKKGGKLPQAVVLTFDETFNYDKFCIAHDLITAEVPYFATHPDNHVPLEGDILHPDIGTFIAAFRVSTGKMPKILGKPMKSMYDQIKAHLSCTSKDLIMIGDRLSTDIKGANQNGILSVLVLSGETDKALARKSKVKADLEAENIGKLIPYL
ncbi:HAD-IIA family hydrolase [Pseudomonadota bacterium]